MREHCHESSCLDDLDSDGDCSCPCAICGYRPFRPTRLFRGGFWLREPNGWGYRICATRYDTIEALAKAMRLYPEARAIEDPLDLQNPPHCGYSLSPKLGCHGETSCTCGCDDCRKIRQKLGIAPEEWYNPTRFFEG